MENKNPHPPAWKIWILIIMIIQLIAAIQSFRIHQQMWDAQNQHLEDRIQLERKLWENLKQQVQPVLHKIH